MKHTGKLPAEQEFIRSKCSHPTRRFVEFTTEEVDQSIPSRCEKMARLHPDPIAVKSKNHILTYGALNATTNRGAHLLLRQGGDKPGPVTLLAEHDELTVAAMMGILKAGILLLAHWLRTKDITIDALAPTLFRSLANTLSEHEPFPEIRVVRLNGERIRPAPTMLRRL